MDIFWTFYLNHLSPLWGYFFEYPTLCSDPFVGLLNGQTDGQLASSICDNAVVILKWP